MIFDFFKYHGTGNDFVLIDNRRSDFPIDKNLIQQLCDRRFGIGADGMILISYKDGCDFEMNYYNSDGNIGSMCGNGGRCAVAFANKLQIIGDHAKFHAVDGLHQAQILKKDKNIYLVKLKMLDVKSVRKNNDALIINTGSPHYINFTSNLNDLDVNKEGRKIRNNEQFIAKGINVDFVEIHKDHLSVRTYERGVENETLSCGTGVIASAIAYASREDKEGLFNIQSRGGMLKVMFIKSDDTFTDIWLEGPSEFVFKGKFEINI